MKTRLGFTLVELVIALTLSAFVLVGIVGVTSQMMRYQMEGGGKSNNTSNVLMSLDSMVRDLQGANVLYCPSNIGVDHTPSGGARCTQNTSTVLSGCIDYSLNTVYGVNGGPIDGNAAQVKSFYYCVWPAASTPTGTPWLLHYSQGPGATTGANASCPISPAPNCGTGAYDVVAQNVYPIAGGASPYYFARANDVNGVQLLFQVGASTSATSPLQTTTYQLINTKIPITRTYTDTID